MAASLLDDARAILPWIVDLRRRIHRRPELGLDLPETQAIVVDTLKGLGLEPRLGRGLSSVTAVIGADRPGRTVLLRADMDALPMPEDTGLEFASEHDGRDALVRARHARRDAAGCGAPAGRPRERRSGLAARPRRAHVPAGRGGLRGRASHAGRRLARWPRPGDDRAGSRSTSPRDMRPARSMDGRARSRPPRTTSRSRSGVAAGTPRRPTSPRDPIPVAAEIVLALQSAVTRTVDVFDPAVLTIGHVAAGTTHNVIPESALLEGTFRCVSDERRSAMPELIRRVVEGVASAHGLTAEVRFQDIYPVTMNDPGVFERVRSIAVDLLGEADVHTMPAPTMPAEDWSFVLQRIPGVIVDLGGRPRDRELHGYPQNHSSLVVFDERRWPSAPPCTRRSRSSSELFAG